MIKFGQGSYGRSQNGEELQSSGHITCYSVALINLETHDALMFHVWEGGHNGLSERQADALKDFLKPLGRKVCFITEGAMSSPSYHVQDKLKETGIDIHGVQRLQTGNARWDALFDPRTRRLTIDDERGVQHYTGIALPNYTGIPAEEQGLSDAERRVLRLKTFAHPKTGDLPPAALKHLDTILEHTRGEKFWTDVGSMMLNQCIHDRAKAAGFDDYTDYLEADAKNFTNVDPQGKEMVLRKISNPHASIKERFKKAGRDFKNVHVTPEAVVDLLRDYPVIVDKLIRVLAAEPQKQLKPAPKRRVLK